MTCEVRIYNKSFIRTTTATTKCADTSRVRSKQYTIPMERRDTGH